MAGRAEKSLEDKANLMDRLWQREKTDLSATVADRRRQGKEVAGSMADALRSRRPFATYWLAGSGSEGNADLLAVLQINILARGIPLAEHA